MRSVVRSGAGAFSTLDTLDTLRTLDTLSFGVDKGGRVRATLLGWNVSVYWAAPSIRCTWGICWWPRRRGRNWS